MLLFAVYNYRQKVQKKSRLRRKKLLIITVIVVIFGVAGGYVLWRRHHRPVVPVTGVPTINYAPATPAEKNETEDTKSKIVTDQNNAASSNTGTAAASKKAVTPTITEASKNSVKAYVTGIFEENGTCVATFTKGSTTLTKSSTGFQNVSYTQCAPMTLESGFLSTGSWSVSVHYASAAAEGSSTVQHIEVQ